MRLKQYLIRRRFPELVGHEVVGQAPLYVTELSMSKGTRIDDTSYSKPGQKYIEVVLENGDVFYVKIVRYTAESETTFGRGYTEMFDKEYPYDYWTINFEDKMGNTDTIAKEKGVGLQLFAAIESIIAKFVKEENPEMIVFSGWGQSKMKLYNLLAKKLAKGIKGKWFTKEAGTGIYYIWK